MREKETEASLEKLLKIRTSGRDDSISNQYNYPYEPTPYVVLERLGNEGYIRKQNTVLDYGCGKGRVGFYLSYQTRCHYVGLDYDERMIETAKDNQNSAVSGNRTSFVCDNAVNYQVPTEVDRCYFFNPFSTEVLEKVLTRITESYYENPRELLLFFYYPSDEYIGRLMQEDTLSFVDEISCKDLFEGEDDRERIMIFQLGY